MKLKEITLGMLILSCVFAGPAFAQSAQEKKEHYKGTIKGRLIDKSIRVPLPGAKAALLGTIMEMVTDSSGNFVFSDIPVGTYTLEFSYPGVRPLYKTDIIVKSDKITFVTAEFDPVPDLTENVTVSAGYFSQTQDRATNSINFSSEEIRRAPGSAGDISRIIYGLPSVAKVNDQINSLVVRGGNPSENAFYVDNIEIPNINHFPLQGTSGGPISLLNVDFIQDVSFSSGGFSALYGDKLSSVMDISLREGNRDKLEAQANLNFAGFGGQAEGPLAKGRGSWMFSLNRSYLDLLFDAIGTGVAPRYGDFQGKIVYDLSPRSKITLLSLLGIDEIRKGKDNSVESGDPVYGTSNNVESATGLSWLYSWSSSVYSQTSLSFSTTKFKTRAQKTLTSARYFDNDSVDKSIHFRNINLLNLGRNQNISFGLEAKKTLSAYDYFFAESTDAFGKERPQAVVDIKVDAYKLGLFAEYVLHPFGFLTLNLGLRGDYFSYGRNFHWAPRFSFSCDISKDTSLTGTAGIYYQSLPLVLLYQEEAFKTLASPRACHFTLGFSHLLSESTRLTVEFYDKEYRRLPLDPFEPELFVLDDLYGTGFFNRQELVDAGQAYSRGIEWIIQKKLKEKFYGMISGTYFLSRYRDAHGKWRDRAFDNRFIFSIEGGWKPNNRWEFSLRWIYSGGAPYTPFDLESSAAADSGIFDPMRINGERLPAYHSLNVRIDKRFYFRSSNLTIFFSIWNAYNRKNIANYFWNEIKNAPDRQFQWSFLPVFGLELEL